MPRVARGLADGQVYHVLNRGNGRPNVFHKEGDFQAFLDLLGEARKRYGIKLFAYCLMSNHFHLLLQTEKGDELSRCMQWLMTSHVRRYHRHYGTSGHVWQGRFKSFIVQQDEHLLTVARYVESNPVRAKMVESAADWPWSSYHYRVGTGSEQSEVPVPLKTASQPPQQGQAPVEPDPIDPLPVMFTDDWATFLEQPFSTNDQTGLRQSIFRQAPFGSVGWQESVCRMFGLESTIRPVGRPKKKAEK
jgi:putative transposase